MGNEYCTRINDRPPLYKVELDFNLFLMVEMYQYLCYSGQSFLNLL